MIRGRACRLPKIRATEHRLYIKYFKCEFWLTFVPSHGHVITDESIRVVIQNIDAIKSCPKPMNPKKFVIFLV